MVVRYVEIAAGLIQSAESLKSAIFGINFPKGVYALTIFLPNLAWGRECQNRTITRNFAIAAFKMSNRQNW